MTNTIYFGTWPRQLKYGRAKIGETQQKYPSRRFAKIRLDSNGKFEPKAYVTTKVNLSKAEIYYVESAVRLQMSRIEGLEYDEDSNDHFDYLVEKGNHRKQVDKYADRFVEVTIEAFKYIGLTTKDLKIKRYK